MSKFIKKNWGFGISLLMLLFLGQSVQAQSQTIEEELQSIMKQYKGVGLGVAVVKDNQLIYTHSFGWKDREKQIPLQNDDLFRIASISKSFSATTIMHLVEEGKVSLDDKVSDLVGFEVKNPKYPDTDITLKMLLSHSSSLNDSQGYFTLDVINPEKNPDVAKAYNDYKPGTEYEYCNLNFNMVGVIIERLTGVRFDKYVHDLILKPLHIYGGYYADELDADKFAQVYLYNDSSKTLEVEPAAYRSLKEDLKDYTIGYDAPKFSPTGGMKISAPGLAKIMMMHMNYGTVDGVRIISEESSKLMQTPVIKANETKSAYYGLAMHMRDDLIPGVTMTGHTGSAYGLYSLMYFNAKEKYGIVLVSTGNKGGYNAELWPLARAVYKHFITNK